MAALIDRVIGGSYGRRRFQGVYKRLHELSLTGLNYGYSDPFLNGEHAFLDRVAETWGARPVVVFDVGAFHGDWSRAVLERNGAAVVHAFEPLPGSYAKLEEELGERARLHRSAVGATAGEAEMTAPESSPDWASLHVRDLSRFGVRAVPVGVVPVRTIDEFCEKEEIARIDMVKLDTEGNELAVLTGAQRMLGARAIDVIQFEFGGANIDSRVFLRDIIGLLEPTYEVFRVLRDGLQPVEVDERAEIFTYANFVALGEWFAPRLPGAKAQDSPIARKISAKRWS